MCRTVICLAFLLASTAAAQPTGTYAVPCQTREEFASRLRSLLADSTRAEDVLARFAIEIGSGTDGFWTLTVSEPANPASQPRTLRQATCTELAEAAALVVAAWADEAPPPTAAEPPPPAAPPPASHVPSAAPVAPQQSTGDGPSEEAPHVRVGLSVRADGAIDMMPTASFGGSAALWLLTADRLNLTSVGIKVWPSHHVPDADILRYQEYARPLWYLFLEQAQYLVELLPIAIGGFGQVGIGSRRADEGGITQLTFGVGAGLDVRWAFSDWFAARAQVGIFFLGDVEEHRPGIATLAVDLTLN